MSSSRLALAVVGAFLATGVSIDPSVRATAPVRPRGPLADARGSGPLADARGSVAEGSARRDGAQTGAPTDMELTITPDARARKSRVVVRRRGYLVSLRHEDARAAGEDWAAMHLAQRAGAGADVDARDRLVWETTRPDTLETQRGLVVLSASGGELRGELVETARPEPAGAWKGAPATCAAQHDLLGGFTVLCRFAKGVRHVGVANVTGARSLDDAWVAFEKTPVVRLDLPRREGGAEGRVVGFTFGQTGMVLRAEASFVEGEAPALVIDEAERTQPAAPF